MKTTHTVITSQQAFSITLQPHPPPTLSHPPSQCSQGQCKQQQHYNRVWIIQNALRERMRGFIEIHRLRICVCVCVYRAPLHRCGRVICPTPLPPQVEGLSASGHRLSAVTTCPDIFSNSATGLNDMYQITHWSCALAYLPESLTSVYSSPENSNKAHQYASVVSDNSRPSLRGLEEQEACACLLQTRCKSSACKSLSCTYVLWVRGDSYLKQSTTVSPPFICIIFSSPTGSALDSASSENVRGGAMCVFWLSGKEEPGIT